MQLMEASWILFIIIIIIIIFAQFFFLGTSLW